MKKSLWLLCFLGIMTCVGNIPAIAAVDEYGNEIDWDRDGSGNEDHAGAEELEEPIMEEVEEIRTSQSESEVESQIQITEETTKASTHTGKVNAIFTAPENFGKHDIVLVIYNKNELKKYEIQISKASGYRTIEEVLYGIYEVRGAYVKGDEVNAYNLGIDTYDFLFDSNNQEINIHITLEGILESQVAEFVEAVEPSTNIPEEQQAVEQTKHIIEKNIVETESSSDSIEKMETLETQAPKEMKLSKRILVVIGVICGMGFAIILKRR